MARNVLGGVNAQNGREACPGTTSTILVFCSSLIWRYKQADHREAKEEADVGLFLLAQKCRVHAKPSHPLFSPGELTLSLI